MSESNVTTSAPRNATPVLSREACEIAEAAGHLAKAQALLDAAACGKLNHRQRQTLRSWGAGIAELAAALVRFADATTEAGR